MKESASDKAIKLRDKAWETAFCIPSWVRGREVSLDQFFTVPDIAEKCLESLKEKVVENGDSLNDFSFIEPSAGIGSFYDLLPKDRRIGIDVDRFRREYIQSDFLTWYPVKNGHRYIAVGNPPFGYRGWLALSFLNHAAEFCDYVGFILPMSFQSEGKGSTKNRVKGMSLLHSEKLPKDVFRKPDGTNLPVHCLWQIWKTDGPLVSKEMPKENNLRLCDKYFELITVDERPQRLCGQKRKEECDFFIQRTFYSKHPGITKDFSEVNYTCGYGVIVKRNKREILRIIKNTDWAKYCNLTTHNCHHISMYHIRQALIDGGLLSV